MDSCHAASCFDTIAIMTPPEKTEQNRYRIGGVKVIGVNGVVSQLRVLDQKDVFSWLRQSLSYSNRETDVVCSHAHKIAENSKK